MAALPEEGPSEISPPEARFRKEEPAPTPLAVAPPPSPDTRGTFASWEDFFRSEPLPRELSLEERNLALLGLSGERGRLFASASSTELPPPPPLPRGLDAFLQAPPTTPRAPIAEEKTPPPVPVEARPLLAPPPPSVAAAPSARASAPVAQDAFSDEKGEEPEVPPLLPPAVEDFARLDTEARDTEEELLSFGSPGFPRMAVAEAPVAPETPGGKKEEVEEHPVVRRTLAAVPPPLSPREFTPAFSEEPRFSGEPEGAQEGGVPFAEGPLPPDDMVAVEEVLRERPSRHRFSLLGRRLAFLFALGALAVGGGWFWWQRPQRFFDQGLDFFQRKEFAQAAALFQQGLQGDAQNAEALFLLGESFRALGSADEALGAYEEVLRLTSGDAMLFVGMGEVHLARGDGAHAVRAFDQALALVPNFTEARKGLGLAYLALGNYIGARDALEQALKGRRDDLPLMKTVAAVRRMLEDPEGAQSLYEEVLALTPEDQEAQEGLAASLREAEERKKAREALRAREEVQGLLDRGFTLLTEGKPQEALGAFFRIRSLDPRSSEALEGLMEAHLALGQKPQAEKAYREALEAASQDVDLRDAVEQARAEALFRHEQLLLFQGTPLLRGEELLREGNPGAALSLFREALSADAGDPRGWKGLGRALLSMGSPDAALGAFRQGAQLSSSDAEIVRGIKESREALELQKRREKAGDLVRRGEEQERRGRQRNALTLYRQASGIVSQDQNALRGMARVSAALGRHGDAATYYRRLLRMASGDLEARRELSRLERLEEARMTPPPVSGDAPKEKRLAKTPETTAPEPAFPTARPLPMTGPVTPAREKLGELHARRGRALAAKEAYTGAAREYRRALELSPWQGTYRNNLGWAFARMGVPEAALAEFRQAALQDGGQAEVQYNYGWALAREGDAPGAVRAFAVSLRLSDDWAGDEYLVLKDLPRSSRDVESAMSEDVRPFVRAAQAAASVRPEEEDLYWNMALAVYEAGLRSPQLAVSPDALERIFLGHAWMAKDPSRAFLALTQEEAGEGWMSSTRMTLVGHAAAREGRRDVAAEAYRRALELDARNDAARLAWQILERQ